MSDAGLFCGIAERLDADWGRMLAAEGFGAKVLAFRPVCAARGELEGNSCWDSVCGRLAAEALESCFSMALDNMLRVRRGREDRKTAVEGTMDAPLERWKVERREEDRWVTAETRVTSISFCVAAVLDIGDVEDVATLERCRNLNFLFDKGG